jgi:hypothetical protein
VATTVARLEAILSADTRQFDRAMGQSESRMRSAAKTAGKAGLAGAVIGLGFAVKAGFSEFMEAERVTAQTNAVLKSTGGVANVTAGQVDKLAASLMRKSGVDDEQIKAGQNMLLTFTKVRNEVGRGNNVFDQATTATLNLSVAMGKDMQSSAILVGKALNDPIKGVSALSRAGVQFTADQKDMIKEMVAAGDTMGAQKLILKELETQFGGSAEAAGKTFGGQVNIAKETLNNLAGDLVAKAMPSLTDMGSWILNTGAPRVKDLAKAFSDNVKPALKDVWDFIDKNVLPILKDLGGLAKATWESIAAVLKDNDKEISRILGAVKTLLSGIGETISWLSTEIVIPILKPMFTTVLPLALDFTIKALDLVVGAITGVKDGFVWIRDKAAKAIKAVDWDATLGVITKPFEILKGIIDKIVDSVKWLIDNIQKIPVPNFGGGNIQDAPITPGNRPRGDAHSPDYAGLNLMGASPVMAPFAAAAAGYGLQVTSGLRPGAITANGTPSDHGVGKALDLAGSANAMASFFMSLIGNRAVKQAFYDPRGSIFGGAWSSYREGGHSDHVHVATYDKGGVLRPGWTMAYNGTGRNEYVSKGAGDVYLTVNGWVGNDQQLAERLREALIKIGRRNGGNALGGFA